MRESVNGRHTGGAWSNGLTGRRFAFAAITVFPRMVKRKKAWYNDSGDSDSRQAVEPARRGEAVKEKQSAAFCCRTIWREFVLAEIKYEIIEEIGVLSENARGWRKELNLVSWNDAAPKFDLRDWDPEHDRMGKGITLSREEAQTLMALLESRLK